MQTQTRAPDTSIDTGMHTEMRMDLSVDTRAHTHTLKCTQGKDKSVNALIHEETYTAYHFWRLVLHVKIVVAVTVRVIARVMIVITVSVMVFSESSPSRIGKLTNVVCL